MDALPLRLERKQRCQCLNIVLEFYPGQLGRKKSSGLGMKKRKSFQFAEEMIMYVENLKESTSNLYLIKQIDHNIGEYKITLQESIVYILAMKNPK